MFQTKLVWLGEGHRRYWFDLGWSR